MFISITYLKVKSLWKVPAFMHHVYKINQQIAGAEGVISVNAKAGIYRNYTLTAWENKESMMRFRNNGAHLQAMKVIGKLSNAYGSYHYEADSIPSWKEALLLLQDHLANPKKRKAHVNVKA
ncbi:hypothetical protein WJR50_32325 [Catalinimonas sp. 4WD22]|uniref:hypothetical protein n=1 Tax=Catalinimonas locisalis TaxID=3133978 RepID=UPI0031017F05